MYVLPPLVDVGRVVRTCCWQITGCNTAARQHRTLQVARMTSLPVHGEAGLTARIWRSSPCSCLTAAVPAQALKVVNAPLNQLPLGPAVK